MILCDILVPIGYCILTEMFRYFFMLILKEIVKCYFSGGEGRGGGGPKWVDEGNVLHMGCSVGVGEFLHPSVGVET
jgi:hypothetical protein